MTFLAAAPIADLSFNGTQRPSAPSDTGESDLEDDLMSIENIGEELQTKVLELKGALHKEEPHVDVRFLLEIQGDVLACVANDLSALPTNQICVLLKVSRRSIRRVILPPTRRAVKFLGSHVFRLRFSLFYRRRLTGCFNPI